MNSQWAIYGLFPAGAQKGRTFQLRSLGMLHGGGGSCRHHLYPNQITIQTKQTPSSGCPRAVNGAASSLESEGGVLFLKSPLLHLPHPFGAESLWLLDPGSLSRNPLSHAGPVSMVFVLRPSHHPTLFVQGVIIMIFSPKSKSEHLLTATLQWLLLRHSFYPVPQGQDHRHFHSSHSTAAYCPLTVTLVPTSTVSPPGNAGPLPGSQPGMPTLLSVQGQIEDTSSSRTPFNATYSRTPQPVPSQSHVGVPALGHSSFLCRIQLLLSVVLKLPTFIWLVLRYEAFFVVVAFVLFGFLGDKLWVS